MSIAKSAGGVISLRVTKALQYSKQIKSARGVFSLWRKQITPKGTQVTPEAPKSPPRSTQVSPGCDKRQICERGDRFERRKWAAEYRTHKSARGVFSLAFLCVLKFLGTCYGASHSMLTIHGFTHIVNGTCYRDQTNHQEHEQMTFGSQYLMKMCFEGCQYLDMFQREAPKNGKWYY